jgi:lipoyl-dependent peroxiredoxin subunit D
MNLEEIKDKIGVISKDAKINLGNLLQTSGSPGLSEKQIYSIALSCAYYTKDEELIGSIKNESKKILTEIELLATETAAVMMAMNNIYYRFLHLSDSKEFSTMPVKLRMMGIANHGIDKIDFELLSLAVSALAGCGMCINAHVDVLKKSGIENEAIQSTIRIAAVINAAAQSLNIGRTK